MTIVTDTIRVEVAYAQPHHQKIITLDVTPGTTAWQAVQTSGMTEFFPELDLNQAPLGLFGQAFGTKGLVAAKDYVLLAGDRIEIYRPLISDPKEARRKRATQSL